MKTNLLKLFILIIILSFGVCLAKDDIKNNTDFKKLAKGLYFYINSLSKNDNVSTGWFKKEYGDEIELMKFRSYCDTKVLEIIETKIYDKNHKLIEHHKDDSPIGSYYDGYADGEIYYRILCGN